MTSFELLALTVGAFVIAWIVFATAMKLDMGRVDSGRFWILPALASGALLAWTIGCIIDTGLLAVFDAVSASAWANQVWFDLLLAIAVAMAFLVPEARRLGMRPWFWVLAVVLTGSIGVLAMLARVLQLRHRSQQA